MKILGSKFTQYFGFLSSCVNQRNYTECFIPVINEAMVPLPVKPNFSGSFSLVQADNLTEITYAFISWWFLLQYFYYFDNEIGVDLLPDLIASLHIIKIRLPFTGQEHLMGGARGLSLKRSTSQEVVWAHSPLSLPILGPGSVYSDCL